MCQAVPPPLLLLCHPPPGRGHPPTSGARSDWRTNKGGDPHTRGSQAHDQPPRRTPFEGQTSARVADGSDADTPRAPVCQTAPRCRCSSATLGSAAHGKGQPGTKTGAVRSTEAQAPGKAAAERLGSRGERRRAGLARGWVPARAAPPGSNFPLRGERTQQRLREGHTQSSPAHQGLARRSRLPAPQPDSTWVPSSTQRGDFCPPSSKPEARGHLRLQQPQTRGHSIQKQARLFHSQPHT